MTFQACQRAVRAVVEYGLDHPAVGNLRVDDIDRVGLSAVAFAAFGVHFRLHALAFFHDDIV